MTETERIVNRVLLRYEVHTLTDEADLRDLADWSDCLNANSPQSKRTVEQWIFIAVWSSGVLFSVAAWLFIIAAIFR